jgi:hypothetical protein
LPDLISGGPDLVCFYLAGSYSPVPESSGHGNGTAAAAAAKIVVTVRLHLDKVFTEVLNDFPGIFATAAVTADIAGVLIGAAFLGKHALIKS